MSTIIDAKGKPCPTPVILAKQAMAAGEHSFTVLVDNTTAVENLKRLAGNQGFGAAVTQGEGVFSVAFTRTGCAACEEAVSAPLPAPGGDWAVFVGRDIIGDGDRELGANLMRMFFYTLVQGEDKPGACPPWTSRFPPTWSPWPMRASRSWCAAPASASTASPTSSRWAR